MSTAPPARSRPELIEHLRIERRSYIIGTLVVWAVIVVAMIVLYVNMEPQMFVRARASSFGEAIRQAMQQAKHMKPLTGEQLMLLEVVELLGAVALFFLNWRFSYVLRRPRWAFVSTTPGVTFPAARWWWWGILAFVSLYYLGFLVPQLILTAVLAHWGTQEIERLEAAPPPSPPSHDD